MFKRLPTDTLNWILLIGVVLLVVEVTFFNGGLIFQVLFSAFLIYVGKKRYWKVSGKVFFWVGIFILFFTILNMIVVRFLVLAAIALFFLHYYRSKNNPERLSPEFFKEDLNATKESLMKVEPLFQQRFFGNQRTSNKAYQWQDINIHGGLGDRVIDLSNTVLPDEAIISIRHFVGNIIIYVPYEVEVSIAHSSVFGRANILGEHHLRLMNQSIMYQTENFKTEKPRVRIITSILSGDIEVKRI